MNLIVRVGKAPGNGTPVFMIPGMSKELSRPFGATWDEERSLWMYPAYYPVYKKVIADFKVISDQVTFSDIAITWIAKMNEIDAQYRDLKLPDGFTFITKPYEHQILGLAHVYYNYRAALFYAPGLGKSKVAIDLIRLLRFNGDLSPVIILGPLVTVKNWAKEIAFHSGNGLRAATVLGTPTQKKKIIERTAAGEFDVLLMTYDTARNMYEQVIDQVSYKIIVADESHLIKTYSSARTRAAIEIGRKAERKIIMSGTPTLGDPRDLYGQFKFLGDYFMPENYPHFCNKFLVQSPYSKYIITGYKNIDVLNARVQELAIRKTKEECLDLPERLPPIDVGFDLSRKQAALYNTLILEKGADLEGFLAAIENGRPPAKITMDSGAVLVNKLCQISSGFIIANNRNPTICTGCEYIDDCVAKDIKPYTKACKVIQSYPEPEVKFFEDNPKGEALDELLDSILADQTNKVIVWCHYRYDLELAEQRLITRKVGYVRVDGSNSSKVQDFADKFNTDPECRVYLAQISTGVGITLNAGNYVIFYSLDFSLGNYLQAMDRNYRIGQERKVTVYRLLGNGTIDWAVAKLLEKKVDVDSVLSTKLTCLTCPHSTKCFDAGIELFDPGCIYQKKMSRPVTKTNIIERDEPQ